MKDAKLALLIVALICAPTIATAQPKDIPIVGFYTGDSVLNLCRHSDNQDAPVDCGTYIAGVIDGMEWGLIGNPNARLPFCLPANATVGQLSDVTLRWLLTHPERRSDPGFAAVQEAMSNAFPCGNR